MKALRQIRAIRFLLSSLGSCTLLVASVALSTFFVSKWLPLLAMTVAAFAFYSVSLSLRRVVRPSYRQTVLAVIAATIAFAQLYLCLLLLSRYPSQHFRLNGDAAIGTAIERIYARRYLEEQTAAWRHFMQSLGHDPEALLKDSDLAWLVKSNLMALFSDLGPELTDRPDPLLFDNYVHVLAIEQQRLLRHFGEERPATATWFLGVIGRDVSRWREAMAEAERDRFHPNEMCLVATQQVLDFLKEVSQREEQRHLFVAAALFSGMLFMTAGYGDIVPNSPIAMMAVFGQFLVYLWVFVILIRGTDGGRGQGTA